VIIDPWPKPQHAHNDDQGAAECYHHHESAPLKETPVTETPGWKPPVHRV